MRRALRRPGGVAYDGTEGARTRADLYLGPDGRGNLGSANRLIASRLGRFFVNRIRWIAGARAGPAAVAQTVLTRVALLFVNLANGVFTARHFGAAGRGVQAAIGLWLLIFTYICTLGVPRALRYHGRKNAADAGRLFGAGILPRDRARGARPPTRSLCKPRAY